MIFRSSLSDEKHAASVSRSSRSDSNSHNDDITLLEDQESHLAARPSLSGKYVNTTARRWVEARLDWRLQWGGALLIYIVVILLAYFLSYRDQYNSIVLTTLRQSLVVPGGVSSGPEANFPQILLLAAAGIPTKQSNFSVTHLGVTSNLFTALNGNVSWCTSAGDVPPPTQSIGPYNATMLPLDTCTLPSFSQNILAIVSFNGTGPPPQLMVGAYSPDQSFAQISSSLLFDPHSETLAFIPAVGDAQITITPSVYIALDGSATTTYNVDVQWISYLVGERWEMPPMSTMTTDMRPWSTSTHVGFETSTATASFGTSTTGVPGNPEGGFNTSTVAINSTNVVFLPPTIPSTTSAEGFPVHTIITSDAPPSVPRGAHGKPTTTTRKVAIVQTHTTEETHRVAPPHTTTKIENPPPPPHTTTSKHSNPSPQKGTTTHKDSSPPKDTSTTKKQQQQQPSVSVKTVTTKASSPKTTTSKSRQLDPPHTTTTLKGPAPPTEPRKPSSNPPAPPKSSSFRDHDDDPPPQKTSHFPPHHSQTPPPDGDDDGDGGHSEHPHGPSEPFPPDKPGDGDGDEDGGGDDDKDGKGDPTGNDPSKPTPPPFRKRERRRETRSERHGHARRDYAGSLHRRFPIAPPDTAPPMYLLFKYNCLNMTVQRETRRMTMSDIVFSFIALLSVLVLSAMLIDRISSWWLRRTMSKRYHLD